MKVKKLLQKKKKDSSKQRNCYILPFHSFLLLFLKLKNISIKSLGTRKKKKGANASVPFVDSDDYDDDDDDDNDDGGDDDDDDDV